MKSCYLVDTHAHLDMSPLSDNVAAVLQRAAEAGVRQVITIGIDEKSSARALELACANPDVYSSVGVHPHDATSADASVIARLAAMASENPSEVVAWGETGLDYAKEYSPREIQKEVFAMQIDAACELGLPLVIHARDANEDALDILSARLKQGCKGVFHCFSGDREVAKRVLDLGFYISVTGVVTFKNAEVTRDVVRYVPSDRLLVETDAPFLSPVPFRGKPNEPVRVCLVAREVARVRKISEEEAACRTTGNAQDLFGLPAI